MRGGAACALLAVAGGGWRLSAAPRVAGPARAVGSERCVHAPLTQGEALRHPPQRARARARPPPAPHPHAPDPWPSAPRAGLPPLRSVCNSPDAVLAALRMALPAGHASDVDEHGHPPTHPGYVAT